MHKLRDLPTWALWQTGVAALSRAVLTAHGRFILLFHGVATRRYPDVPLDIQPSLTKDELRLILSWLKKHFSFLTPTEFLESNKTGVLLTFDDGLATNCTNALPLLTEFQAPAIFFVSTQHVISPRNWLNPVRDLVSKHWRSVKDIPKEIAADCYDGMSRAQLVKSAQNPLITIGSHTVSHPFLTRCTRRQLEFELHSSKRLLSDLTGKPIDLFAYPTGNYNQTVVQAVQAAGYRAGFAVDSLDIRTPDFEIPRVGIYSANPAYLSVKLSGLHRRALKPEFSHQSRTETSSNRAFALAASSKT